MTDLHPDGADVDDGVGIPFHVISILVEYQS